MRLRAPTVVAADAHLLVVEVERDEVAGLDVDAVALGAGRVVEVFVEEQVGAGAEELQRVARAGWSTNSVTRPLLLENLRDWFEADGAIDRVRDRKFISECLTFRLQANGRFDHDPGCHDDSLFKWGIANMLRITDWSRGGMAVSRCGRYT